MPLHDCKQDQIGIGYQVIRTTAIVRYCYTGVDLYESWAPVSILFA